MPIPSATNTTSVTAVDPASAPSAITEKIDDHMTELAKAKEERGKEAFEESDAVYYGLRRALIALVVVALAVATVIGFFITRLIVTPLVATVRELELPDPDAVGSGSAVCREILLP